MGYILPVTSYQSMQYANRMQRTAPTYYLHPLHHVTKAAFDHAFQQQSLFSTSSPEESPALKKQLKQHQLDKLYTELTGKGGVINKVV
ncbi:hypothetical protein FZC66_15420 [Priestia megaterium]|nr:hypothetical protein FZC66_15420 [Priestia megaterium]